MDVLLLSRGHDCFYRIPIIILSGIFFANPGDCSNIPLFCLFVQSGAADKLLRKAIFFNAICVDFRQQWVEKSENVDKTAMRVDNSGKSRGTGGAQVCGTVFSRTRRGVRRDLGKVDYCDTPRIVRSLRRPAEALRPACWSPDGRLFAFRDGDRRQFGQGRRREPGYASAPRGSAPECGCERNYCRRRRPRWRPPRPVPTCRDSRTVFSYTHPPVAVE